RRGRTVRVLLLRGAIRRGGVERRTGLGPRHRRLVYVRLRGLPLADLYEFDLGSSQSKGWAVLVVDRNTSAAYFAPRPSAQAFLDRLARAGANPQRAASGLA